MSADATSPVLVGDDWRPSEGLEYHDKHAPKSGQHLGRYPVSPWSEVSEALDHASAAYLALKQAGSEGAAAFLEAFAAAIEAAAEELLATAHLETALPAEPRLRSVELPRTVDQLRQAASAARDRAWTLPTLSPAARIASYLAPIPGVVVVFGPNNFPFAFNSASGGDFATAVASGHPVLAKANPGHPETTRKLARVARASAATVGLPPGVIQLVYRTSHEDGERLVTDPRVAATGFTGSRRGGLALKAAADRAGKPIYVEMSSVNPVILLPGALQDRESLVDELAASALLGVGQFCTSPGLLIVPTGEEGDAFVEGLAERMTSTPEGTLLDEGVRAGLEAARERWGAAGARLVAQAQEVSGRCRYPTTVMTVSEERFLANPDDLQTEAFGNMSLVVRYEDLDGCLAILATLEGNLTGSIYTSQSDDENAYRSVAAVLRDRVGRLLNNKTPTGVSVVAAMNHGGPYPSTGHPGFTAVGMPASLRRFGMLQSFDAVAPERLPLELQPDNPLGLQRFVDGAWTREAVVWGPNGEDPLTDDQRKRFDSAQRVNGVLSEGEVPRQVAMVSFLEGPAAHPDGSVFFSDIAADRIMRLNPDGRVKVFREDSGRANGNVFDLEGRLVTCEGAEFGPGGRRITRTDLVTGKREVLTDRLEGRRYNGPNDIVVDSRSRIFFSDSRYGDRSDLEMDCDAVYRIDLDGSVHRIITPPAIERPNGLAITPNADTLYMVDSHPRPGGNRKIWAFPLNDEGEVGSPRLVYDFAPGRGGDGMELDQEGNLYVCAGIFTPRGPGETADVSPGVYVISPNGRLLDTIPVPHDTITNCCFGGEDFRTLSITVGASLFQVRTHIPGYHAYPGALS